MLNLHYSDRIVYFNKSSGIKYHKSYISKLEIENPIAYITETKIILIYVLSIIFSFSLEDIFSKYKWNSIRKTYYLKIENITRE